MSKDIDTVFEIKKEISVNSIMQLIDLNGSKKNFRSKFILETTDPSKKVSVCVVNQDELDNGKINFEETERGKYARLVTYQNDKHTNHYIAVKKHSDDKDEKSVDCVLIIHMNELPAIKKDNLGYDDEEIELQTPRLNPNMPDETKDEIRQTLLNLRKDQQYNNMPDIKDVNDVNDNLNQEIDVGKNDKKIQYSYMNSYLFMGIIFLCIFGYIFYTKKIKKY